jgi:SMODS domain-containing protein
MARTIDEAFDTLVGRLTPTGPETTTAASHRTSIEECLKSNFGMTNFFRSGSFGYGTSVSGFSDVDYFAVIPASKLQQNSNTSLEQIRGVLQRRFPTTRVHVNSPAVVVPFGSSLSEQHEIIPAHYLRDVRGYRTYGIPDRSGGWMVGAPDAHAAYLDREHRRLSERAKPLIRLVKSWKYQSKVRIGSFYLEMRIAEYCSQESSIIYRIDMLRALQWLQRSYLSDMRDLTGISEPFSAGSSIDQAVALGLLNTAISHAANALGAETNGRISEAFAQWDQVFNGQFPGYY